MKDHFLPSNMTETSTLYIQSIYHSEAQYDESTATICGDETTENILIRKIF